MTIFETFLSSIVELFFVLSMTRILLWWILLSWIFLHALHTNSMSTTDIFLYKLHVYRFVTFFYFLQHIIYFFIFLDSVPWIHNSYCDYIVHYCISLEANWWYYLEIKLACPAQLSSNFVIISSFSFWKICSKPTLVANGCISSDK